MKLKVSKGLENAITLLLIIGALVSVIFYSSQLYTASAALVMAIMLATARYIFKVNWLGHFYVVYLLLLLPFCIVNGLLTGTGIDAPVVWYNETQIIDIRLMTIPVEDIFYGFDLILLNLLIYNWRKEK